MNTTEEWRPVVGWEGYYQVSTLGNIKRTKSSKGTSLGLLKLSPDRWGYATISMRRPGERLSKRVHRIVAENFISNPEDKPQVNHKDGNKLNNCVDNLEWNTSKENITHSLIVLKKGIGVLHGHAKLNESQVREIRELSAGGMSDWFIAKIMPVHMSTIWSITTGKTWRHVQ